MKDIIKFIIPLSITKIISSFIQKRKRDKYLIKLKKNILIYHQSLSTNKDVNMVIDYLKSNPIQVFPYQFTRKYTKESINVFLDKNNGLKYVLHDNKKLYFKRSMNEGSIKGLYRGLQIDQDLNSPHLYLTNDFNLNSKDVIADIGCAEGNFTLDNIEKIKKAYLFESDLEWIEALEATFKPWVDKVTIVNKYVTNTDSNKTVNINSFYHKNKDITFFKVDIEGEEQKFLNACEPILNSDLKFKIAICTYHKHNDENDFTKQLTSYGFEVKASEGFMIFIYDNLIKEPYLRKGILRASK